MIEVINSDFLDYKFIREPSLTFMDPPDNIGFKYNQYNDNMRELEYIHAMWAWLSKACYITNGPVFISFNEKWTGIVEQGIAEGDIKVIQRLYWYYTFGQNCKRKYTPCVRPIYWLNSDVIYPEAIKIESDRQKKYGDKRAKSGGKLPNNVWEFSRVCGTFKERRPWVPTQHPEALIRRIILGHSKPGDLVLDPFCGSGTTAIVCQEENRNCITMDIDELYVEKAKQELDERIQSTATTE